MKKLLEENRILIIIKGSVDNPVEEQSKELVNKMFELKCEFAAVDILAKPEFLEYFENKD
jgi:glutaredoxin-related protein